MATTIDLASLKQCLDEAMEEEALANTALEITRHCGSGLHAGMSVTSLLRSAN